MAMFKGWDIKGRPFTEAEYYSSHLHLKTEKSYAQYLRAYDREQSSVPKKNALKKMMHYDSDAAFVRRELGL